MLPTVFLNHLFLYVDADTRDAIANSGFMKNEFAAHEVSCVATDEGKTWTGLYLDGEHTYLELFGPSEGASVGDTGVCLGVEQAGELAQVEQICRQFGVARQVEPVNRAVNGQQIPWFRYLELADIPDHGAPFAPSVMEYDVHYLGRMHAGVMAPEAGITRQKYNSLRFRPERYLQDIESVTLALAPAQLDLFARQLLALGYQPLSSADCTSLLGPGIRFDLRPQEGAQRGILALGMRLRREKQGEKSYRFAQGAELIFDSPRTATWHFYPDPGRRPL